MSDAVVVCALYHFIELDALTALQQRLYAVGRPCGIQGTILLAQEGINGTFAGSSKAVDTLLAAIRRDVRLAKLSYKLSTCEHMPFRRFKVRLKREIVTLGIPSVDPTKQVGEYVEPEAWNALIADPDVCVVDTRNHYECAIGRFASAVNPQTETFREFPQYVAQHLDPKRHRKVAMYCTGGIRCEKASSYMLSQGFEKVYHLKGGILKYLERIPADQSAWQGECFVFDERVALGHNLKVGSYDQCHACRRPIDTQDKQSKHYQPGISCPQCITQTTPQQKTRFAERQHQMNLAKSRKCKHIGA